MLNEDMNKYLFYYENAVSLIHHSTNAIITINNHSVERVLIVTLWGYDENQ